MVGNAVKYSPPGAQVRLTVKRQHDTRGAWVVVEVRDQGIGIPAADLPYVFERFHRAEKVSAAYRVLAWACPVHARSWSNTEERSPLRARRGTAGYFANERQCDQCAGHHAQENGDAPVRFGNGISPCPLQREVLSCENLDRAPRLFVAHGRQRRVC